MKHKRSSSPQPGKGSTVHPVLYRIIIGLTAVWVVVAWGFFAGGGYASFVVAVVTFIGITAVVLPAELLRIRRKHRNVGNGVEQNLQPTFSSFRRWLARDFNTPGGRLKGIDAAVEILLPIAVASIGGLLFVLAFLYATR
jgi:hypothetical protein